MSDVWPMIHTERGALVEMLTSLSPEQWTTASNNGDWSVQKVAGHLTGSAEMGFGSFYGKLIGSGFNFTKMGDRLAEEIDAAGPDEIVRRLEARTSTTNHPPGPSLAMLGEAVVHGEDIRRPLGVTRQVPEAALRATADFYKRSNLIIGAKRRIAGVKLTATDADWAHGDGPEVSGPLVSLVYAMTGRKSALDELSGEGVGTLRSRP